MVVMMRCERLPGLVEWEAQQKAVLLAEKELLAGAQPGNEQWQAQHRAALSDQRTTMETATATTATSATATQTGLKSILDLAFQRLLSKLKLRQNHKEDDDDIANDILRTGKKEESGNSNYLDLLLNFYHENDKEIQGEVPRSFRKPSISFDEELFYDNEYYDDYHTGDRQRFSKRFRFLYEDDSDINLAVKQSRQLDRSLRRFLSKLDKF